jgi:hypothetical protein
VNDPQRTQKWPRLAATRTGPEQKTDPQRMEVSAMSSLQLASRDGGRVRAAVIRKAVRLRARAVDVDGSEVPSLAEQRALRRRLRGLAPDKRSGLRGAA